MSQPRVATSLASLREQVSRRAIAVAVAGAFRGRRITAGFVAYWVVAAGGLSSRLESAAEANINLRGKPASKSDRELALSPVQLAPFTPPTSTFSARRATTASMPHSLLIKVGHIIPYR